MALNTSGELEFYELLAELREAYPQTNRLPDIVFRAMWLLGKVQSERELTCNSQRHACTSEDAGIGI